MRRVLLPLSYVLGVFAHLHNSEHKGEGKPAVAIVEGFQGTRVARCHSPNQFLVFDFDLLPLTAKPRAFDS